MSGRSYNTYQNSTSLVLDYIQSRSFLLEFIENRKIKPDLMASISWDKASNKNIYNEYIRKTWRHKHIEGVYDLNIGLYMECPTKA